MTKENLRRAITISHGNPAVFFTRPLSMVLLVMALLLLVAMLVPSIAKRREKTF